MDYLLIIAGLAGLYFGGDWLVKGAISLSERLGLSTFLISLTVVGFGTSMPELLVSVRAALAGAPGLALGNVVGSNIANILLIIGAAALIAPMITTAVNSRRDIIVMLAATVAVFIMLFVQTIGFLIGLVLVASLIGYLTLAYFQDSQKVTDEKNEGAEPQSLLKTVMLISAGLALLVGGADFLVRGATAIALDFGVSNAVIGLTIVAVGTSLPELATSITAALKRQSDIAIGNVVGSNIFNLLGILGVTATISPIAVDPRFQLIDGWVLLAATALLFGLLLMGKNIGRIIGAAFLAAYTIYMLTMA